MMTLKRSTCMCVVVCVLVPGLYSQVDGSSEGNQVDFCLVKDGNLLTIFGEKREESQQQVNAELYCCLCSSELLLIQICLKVCVNCSGHSSRPPYLLPLPHSCLPHPHPHHCHHHPLPSRCCPHPRYLLGGDEELVRE